MSSGDAGPITVVIPAHDATATITEALASALAQPPVAEVVVVDDGSTDDTSAVARAAGPRVRVLHQRNAGPSAARNRGVAAATSPLVAFLDADDAYVPGHLERAVAELTAHPEAEVVLGHVRLVGFPPEDLARYRFEGPGWGRDGGVGPTEVGPGWGRDGGVGPVALLHHMAAGVYRREVFERVGGLDEALRHFEDYDWFLRAREAGAAIRVLDHVAFEYRHRPGSVSRSPRPDGATVTAVLARSLARRRAAGIDGTAMPTLSDHRVPR